MNNFIYNIKHIHDNYMFHNKELSVNDIVWGYEPKGKRMFKYNEISKCYKGKMQLTIGTGKVIAKYKVVEVYDLEDSKQKIAFLMQTPDKQFNQWCEKHFWAFGDTQSKAMRSYEQFGYTNQRYAYKLEKIEDVSMELSEFMSLNKLYDILGNSKQSNEKLQNNEYDLYRLPMYSIMGSNKSLYERTKLTRYNGLTKVILRSEKE